MALGGITKLSPVQQQSAPLRYKIIGALRSAIELGVLEPGTRLVEKDLCQQLDVSRTSLREALRELESEGVLEQTSSRGLTVRDISVADAVNIYRLRAVIEALAVEQLIEKADDVVLKQVLREGEATKTAYRSGVVGDIVRVKRGFYNLIFAGAENMVASTILNRLLLPTSHLRRRSLLRKERLPQSVKEIDRLIKAIQKRDVEEARQAAIDHVYNSAKSSLNLSEFPGGTIQEQPAAPAPRRRTKS